MKVRNITYHLVHVGNVSISPGQIAEVPVGYETSINLRELEIIKTDAAVKAATAKAADKK